VQPSGGGGDPGVSADAWLEHDKDYREDRKQRKRAKAKQAKAAKVVKQKSAVVSKLPEAKTKFVPLSELSQVPEIAGLPAIAAYLREYNDELVAQRQEAERIRIEEEEAIASLMIMLVAA
jgi:hypothetical protein